jgi:hypothetical protein
LIGEAEDMSIILGESSDSHKSMENSTPLVTVNCSQFRPSYGQIAIASLPGVENHDMERAIHRFKFVLNFIALDWRIHGIIKLRVPTFSPYIKLG